MNNNKLIIEACLFAAEKHKGQTRKYPTLIPGVGKVLEPYINHPLEVAAIVARHEGTAEMIAAAVLHDVVEDCGVIPATIEGKFGFIVASLVLQVTDVSRREDGTRKVRKEVDKNHIAKASPNGKTIKLADLLSNLKNVAEKDPEFAKVYMREKRNLLEVLENSSSPALYWEVNNLITEYFRTETNEQHI